MATENASSSCSTCRCPSISIAAVLVALCVAYGVQIWGLYTQRSQIKKLEASYENVLPQVRTVTTKLQGISQDLLKMSSTSPAADRIVREFNIKQNSPAGQEDSR